MDLSGKYLLTRKYAEMLFPNFVKKVEKELEIARKGTKELLAESPARPINQLADPRKRHPYWIYAGDQVDKVAELAKQGKSKMEIAKEMDLKLSTIYSYLTMARGKGILPKNFFVKDR